MDMQKYAEGAKSRLAHIKSHLEKGFKVDQLVNNIVHDRGNPRASVYALASHAQAVAMKSWFGDSDLDSARSWCFTAGQLMDRYTRMEPDVSGPGSRALRLLEPLISNNVKLISSYAEYDAAFDLKRVENHRTHDFWAYQSLLALRGDWEALLTRSERILADPPNAAAERKYLIDYQFYRGLALRDLNKTEDALREIVSLKAIDARRNDESGFTSDLISTIGVVYSKLAWRSGLKVNIRSPYIPTEWMALDPLVEYINRYPFL